MRITCRNILTYEVELESLAWWWLAGWSLLHNWIYDHRIVVYTHTNLQGSGAIHLSSSIQERERTKQNLIVLRCIFLIGNRYPQTRDMVRRKENQSYKKI